MVEGALKSSSKTGSPLALVFIDLAKAFDSVSHRHIRAALVQRMVDPAFVELVGNAYKGGSTRVRTGSGYTRNIALKIGVKQGDPLSPLLFNLAIDPLLYTLEETSVGFGSGGSKVTVLAYADDLVMFSDSWEGMTKNMSILEAFCNLTGSGLIQQSVMGSSQQVEREQPVNITTAPLGHWVGQKYTWWGLRRPLTTLASQ